MNLFVMSTEVEASLDSAPEFSKDSSTFPRNDRTVVDSIMFTPRHIKHSRLLLRHAEVPSL